MALIKHPLPEKMSGRPYGKDENGHPLNRTKGVTVRATVEYAVQCVADRAARDLPADMDSKTRAERINQARAGALNEIIGRFNSAISDPAYHLTESYLYNEGNSYSVEFDLFMSVICAEVSQDPAFDFHRGSQSISEAIARLARPLPLKQVYTLIPRFATWFAATDFRVERINSNSAVIQWRCESDLNQLRPDQHYTFIEYSCQFIQGTMASIPNKLNPHASYAQVTELRCQLNGDECCEWEFTWDEEQPRGLFGLFAHKTETPREEPIASSAASPSPEPSLPPFPKTMLVRPYGEDENGKPIREINGVFIRNTIEYMLETIAPQGLSPAGHVTRARTDAIDDLVELLNAAIPDPRYHLTPKNLMNLGYTSFEFSAFVRDMCARIADTPHFYFRQGQRVVQSIAYMVSALSLRQAFSIVPRFAEKFADISLRVVQVDATSATLSWHAGSMAERVSPELLPHVIYTTCQTLQGCMAYMPVAIAKLPPAKIKEIKCQLHGDEYCEWRHCVMISGISLSLMVQKTSCQENITMKCLR